MVEKVSRIYIGEIRKMSEKFKKVDIEMKKRKVKEMKRKIERRGKEEIDGIWIEEEMDINISEMWMRKEKRRIGWDLRIWKGNEREWKLIWMGWYWERRIGIERKGIERVKNYKNKNLSKE